mmetsp:Transcript_25536/g.42624  ORF Transcript_25536/g.42624 Transcript_25536/m.42624 type:complete len:239 (-) Transcript_25536:1325-2041(-)
MLLLLQAKTCCHMATVASSPLLHNGISRSTPSFWNRPFDILLRCLDGTALAMHTILGVDDKAALPCFFICISVFVNTGRTKALFGACECFDGHLRGHVRQVGLHSQVRRLVVVVRGAGSLQVGQQVEGQHAVGFGVVDLCALLCWQGAVGVRDGVRDGPGLFAAGDHAGEACVGKPGDGPAGQVEGGVGVAHDAQFVRHPRCVQCCVISPHLLPHERHTRREQFVASPCDSSLLAILG